MDKNNNTVTFDWIDLNDETFKQIQREDCPSSELVLGLNDKGSMAVGRIHKENPNRFPYKDGYMLELYIGGGLNKVIKFVRVEKLIN